LNTYSFQEVQVSYLNCDSLNGCQRLVFDPIKPKRGFISISIPPRRCGLSFLLGYRFEQPFGISVKWDQRIFLGSDLLALKPEQIKRGKNGVLINVL